jgi:HemY protein
MKELIEGRWSAAEVTLMKSVAHSQAPALHYAGAAQAAQRLNQPMRRDGYLRRAIDMPERDALALELVRAEILIDDNRLADARELLERLHRQHPTNARTLELLATLYRDLGQWSDLKDLMPQAVKYKALPKTSQAQLERDMYQALLNDAGRRGALEELHVLWDEMPEPLREDEMLLIDYVGHLRDSNAAGEAETLLRGALQRQWSDKLVVGYGEIGRGDSFAQLQAAEGWLRQHGDNPYLLLTLGRLAKRCRQNDKARRYLEQSIAAMPMPDTYQELGILLDEMDQKEAAKQCYRLGLRLASGRLEEKEGGELLPAETAEQKATAVEHQRKQPVPAAPDQPSPSAPSADGGETAKAG